MTRTELLRIAKARHKGDNWIVAFAKEIGVSYWTIYRIAKQNAGVSELVKLKVERLNSNKEER